MRTFFVVVRDNIEHDLKNFFPHIADNYTSIARLFKKGKKYPVLAVDPVTLIGEDGENIESSRFLIPTENNNIIWVLAEIFTYSGLTE